MSELIHTISLILAWLLAAVLCVLAVHGWMVL